MGVEAAPNKGTESGGGQWERARLQPNSRHCFVCGMDNHHGLAMRFYSIGSGQVEARYTVDPAFQGYPGVVHGGIIASMLDEVVGRVMMTEDPNQFFVTAKLEIRYRAPVPVGEPLRLVGQLERRKGNMTFAAGRILLPNGTLAVEASAILVRWREDPVDQDALDSIGWRVYEDEQAGHETPTEGA
jgi:uncharacterized protein (TIGR00369 family)